MEGPQSPPLRVESTGFQSSFDGGVAGVNLRSEPAHPSASSMIYQSFEQSSTDAAIAPGMLDEQFDEIHRLPTVFGTPLVTGIGKPTDPVFVLRHQNDSKFRGLQNPLVNALSFSRSRPGIPFMQQLFREFTQTWNIGRLALPDPD